MSTQRYRVITQSGIHIGEEFYELNAILNLTAIGAKYLLLNKQIALAAGQAPVGEDPDDPSEDDVMIDIKVGTQTEAVSLTKLREMFPSIKGDKGDPGEQGPVGSRGQKGDKGDKGEQGRGITLAGVVAAFANLPQEAEDGQVYVTQDTGHGWAWITDAWNDIGQFKGDKGDQGPIGPQGIRGQVGDKGDKGDPGDPGNPTYASRAELGATNAAASEEAAAGHAADAAATAETVLGLAAETQGYRDDAQAAQVAAATSEANAAGSATAASTSEANAATHESNASGFATAASGSAVAANQSATTAGGHATAAATSESNAATFAGEAQTHANAAATSEGNANSSAAAAALSESNAATSATNAATSATNAQTTLQSFKGIYYGALATDPALDPNGAAVSDGDFYFNTATKKMRFYNGTAWADMVAGGTQKRFIYTATAGQTTFTGADTFSNALAYTPGCIEVVVNGLWVPYSEYTATNGTSIVLSSGSTAGDVVYVFALAAFTIADVCARSLNGSDILDKAAFRSNLGFGITSGKIGERIEANGATGNLVTGVAQRVCKVDVPVGTWDLEFSSLFQGSGSTQTSDWITSISVADADVSVGNSAALVHTRMPAAFDYSINHTYPRVRVTVTGATKSYYLNAAATVSTGTVFTCTGKLQATRVDA